MKNKKNINRNMAYLLVFIAFLLLALGIGNTIYSVYDCTTTKKAYADDNGNSGGVFEDVSYNFLVPIPYTFQGGDYVGISLNTALTVSLRPGSIYFGCDVSVGSFADFVYEEKILQTNHETYFRAMAYGYNYVDLGLDLHNIVIGVVTNIDLPTLEPSDYTYVSILQNTDELGEGVKLDFHNGKYIFLKFYFNAGSDEGTVFVGEPLELVPNTAYYRISLGNASLASIETYIKNSYDEGYDDGYRFGSSQVNEMAYDRGYLAGVNTANSGTFLSLFDALFFSSGRFFTSLLNFEILGVNFLGFVTGLIGISVAVAVLRILL